MTDIENEILFEDPDDEILEHEDEEALDELLESDQATEEVDHQEIVKEVQQVAKSDQAERKRWSPSGACIPGAELVENSSRYCQDGVMVDQPSNETTDPDSMNWLLALQKKKLEPYEAGPIPIGGSYRSPDYEALEQVMENELACPVCSEKFTEEDCDFHDLGQLVSYNGVIYHWACLGLWMLVICKGHPDRASELFHVPLPDMRALKTSYRCLPWGRLGFRQPGTEGGKQ